MFKENLSCVSVCINYSDFLDHTLRYNRVHFDKYVVVTSPDDEDTRSVCRKYEVTCLTTEDATRDGDFSKGRLIERGLQHLPADSWILHLDADIVLPTAFRKELDLVHLDPECIYGCDRIMVKSYEDWQKLLQSGWMTNNFYGNPHATLIPNGYQLGTRWVGSDGWCPIGFFSLHHRIAGGEEWR